jgi:hypothetical protein
MPNYNLFIMLDCTKTSKGLFFGILVFALTLVSFFLFLVFKPQNYAVAILISEMTEILLLLISLVLTCFAFQKVLANYSKVVPEINMFDIGLEILSLCGVYAYSINSLLGIFYDLAKNHESEYYSVEDFINFGFNETLNSHTIKSIKSEDNILNEINKITEAIARILSLIQSSIQTFFILECLRRYAEKNKSFMRKPARELITSLLIVNVSLWFFDTFSAKRFDTKEFLIEHFGIIKWSIINAFSSPLAIFYRFHSSVCLSDIWYCLYYGENQTESDDEE